MREKGGEIGVADFFPKGVNLIASNNGDMDEGSSDSDGKDDGDGDADGDADLDMDKGVDKDDEDVDASI